MSTCNNCLMFQLLSRADQATVRFTLRDQKEELADEYGECKALPQSSCMRTITPATKEACGWFLSKDSIVAQGELSNATTRTTDDSDQAPTGTGREAPDSD